MKPVYTFLCSQFSSIGLDYIAMEIRSRDSSPARVEMMYLRASVGGKYEEKESVWVKWQWQEEIYVCRCG